MALQNPSNLYEFGNVKVDSTPSVALYGQLMARKQAKDEAIDDYYRKLPHTINTAGMRDQDRAGLDQAINEWQKYGMQNKDKIRKGRNQEAFDFDARHRAILAKIEESKNRAKTDLELGKMRFSKENSYIFDDPSFMKTQSKHSLPIWDANHKELDLGTVAIPPRPFGDDEQGKLWATATKGLTPGKQYDYTKSKTNPQTGQVIVPFQKTFSPEQVKKIAEQYAGMTSQDKSAKAYYNNLINTPNKDEWEELQNAYVKYFPNDIVDTPEKAAAADAIIRATVPQEVGEEQELNYSQRQDDKRININLNKGGGGVASPNDLANYDVLETYKNKVSEIVRKKDGVTETFKGINIKDVDTKDQELIGVKPYKDNGLTYYKVRPDGDWEGAGGQVISWAKVAQANLDKTAANEVKRGRTQLTADKTKGASQSSGMVTVVLKDGRTGQIPANQLTQFLKDNPGAKKQ